MTRSIQDAVEVIVGNIDKLLDRYGPLTYAEFAADEDLQLIAIARLTRIGEAVKRIDLVVDREDHPQVEWGGAIGMKNWLVHGYDTVDLPTVWEVLEQDLAPLRQGILMVAEDHP